MDWGKKSYHFKTKNKYLQIPSPEGSSGEGREAESDDCADVPLERRVEDALPQAEHGLVHEAQSQTQLNVLVRGGDLGGGGGGGIGCEMEQEMGPTRILFHLLNDKDCIRESVGVTNQSGNGVLLEDIQAAFV